MRTHNLIQKANNNPKSFKAAIAAKCFECVGGTRDSMPDTGYKEIIRDCASKSCPLMAHRPYQ